MTKSAPVIVGVDEAGRGPLAGPVVAGACIEIEALRGNPHIRDSKQMTPEERDAAFAWIMKNCTVGYGIVDATFIDTHGILAATERAMQEAVAMVARVTKPTFLIVDGRDKFWFDYPHTSIIGGDDSEPAIGAASIVAKVTRDRLMTEAHTTFPVYSFDQHKGYGTPEHTDAIRRHGPCEIHRKTFIHLSRPSTHSARSGSGPSTKPASRSKAATRHEPLSHPTPES